MNNCKREVALYKIQEIIVKETRENKEKNIQKFKEKMQPLFIDRNEVIMGNEEIIKKYVM